MYNVSFSYAGVKGVNTWDDSVDSLKPLQNKLLEFFARNEPPLPIHIVWLDYVALMSDDSIADCLNKTIKENERNNATGAEKEFYKPTIIIGTQPSELMQATAITIFDKKIKQFDNNIYTWYCQIDKWEIFHKRLLKCLEGIKTNYTLKLYDLQVTKEYYELYLRMIRNNHLNGDHSSAVIPFVFTSEEEMDIKVLEYTNHLNAYIQTHGPISLNLLLVDDYAIKQLKAIDKTSNDLKNKKEILEAVWRKFTDDKNVKININISAIAEPEIEGLNRLPKLDTPDIILLDYNFNKPKSGVDFIKSLTESESKRLGPFDKFWIFPITSFSSSFIDELQNQGLGFIHEKYELSRGADFINTPRLFLFYMMQMIWGIIRKSDLTNVSIEIKSESEKINKYEGWDDLSAARNNFENDYSRILNIAWHIEHILQATTGILKDVRENLETKLTFIKRLNIYKELLFNLTSKNYNGNDDIIVLLNQLNDNAE